MTGLSTKVRRAVADRDHGWCLRCGARGTNQHHRVGKGMGGSSRPEVEALSAIVTVCGMGNVSGCHGWIETHRELAYVTGWAIRRSNLHHPSTIALVDLAGRSFRLDDQGGITVLSVGLLPTDPADHLPVF